MTTISISDIAKKPSLLDNIDDIAQIVNKKTHEVKGFFISAKDTEYIKELIQEIEYKKWHKRNAKGLADSQKEFSPLFENVVGELGEKL